MLSDSFLYDRLMQNAVQQQNKKERVRDNSNTSGRGRQQTQKKKKHVIRGKIVQQVILGVKGMKDAEQDAVKTMKKDFEEDLYDNRHGQYDEFEMDDRKTQDRQVLEVMLNEEAEDGKEKANDTEAIDERIMTQQFHYNPELDNNADASDTQSNIQLLKDQLEGRREPAQE